MKFILGQKIRMSQMFDENGKVIPVTIVEAGPCLVTQIRNNEKDGYQAVQIGFGKTTFKHIRKPQREAFKKIGLKEETGLKWLREFKVEKVDHKVGDEVKADIFNPGDTVKVAGISKGKGFQGVVKRHGFKGGPASHGQKHSERKPGSIGSSFPERVVKGKKMAGRMGFDRITVAGLKIAEVDSENNILAVKGAIPGKPGTLLAIVATKEAKPVEKAAEKSAEEVEESKKPDEKAEKK